MRREGPGGGVCPVAGGTSAVHDPLSLDQKEQSAALRASARGYLPAAPFHQPGAARFIMGGFSPNSVEGEMRLRLSAIASLLVALPSFGYAQTDQEARTRDCSKEAEGMRGSALENFITC